MSRFPKCVIRQSESTYEIRVVSVTCLLNDIELISIDIDDLHKHRAALLGGGLPVGSVAFLQKAMEICRIDIPKDMTYPKSLMPHMNRRATVKKARDVFDRCFIKPTRVKAFGGFVYDPEADPATLSFSDQDNLELFKQLGPNESVWVTDVIDIAGEWRYYVLDGALIGNARYDPDGEEGVTAPDIEVVRKMAFQASLELGTRALTIDVGLLKSGETTLIECNDAWAIGMYKGAMSNDDYLNFLWCRWSQLLSESTSLCDASALAIA